MNHVADEHVEGATHRASERGYTKGAARKFDRVPYDRWVDPRANPVEKPNADEVKRRIEFLGPLENRLTRSE